MANLTNDTLDILFALEQNEGINFLHLKIVLALIKCNSSTSIKGTLSLLFTVIFIPSTNFKNEFLITTLELFGIQKYTKYRHNERYHRIL